MTVMLVDDNRNFRRMVKSILAGTVEQFFECNDGSEAVEAYDLHHPDWVLMDIQMPNVDGITATRMLKDAYPEARIIILSSFGDDGLRESARSAGADAYVLKEQLSSVNDILRS